MEKIERMKCPCCGAEMKEKYLISTSRNGEADFFTSHEDEACLACPNCFFTQRVLKEFTLTKYTLLEDENDEDYDSLFKDYLKIKGGLNILFFDNTNKRMSYKKFISEYDKFDFLERVCSLIIKSDEAIAFANKLFKEEDKPFIEKGVYKYSWENNSFLKYEDALEHFRKEWEPILKFT